MGSDLKQVHSVSRQDGRANELWFRMVSGLRSLQDHGGLPSNGNGRRFRGTGTGFSRTRLGAMPRRGLDGNDSGREYKNKKESVLRHQGLLFSRKRLLDEISHKLRCSSDFRKPYTEIRGCKQEPLQQASAALLCIPVSVCTRNEAPTNSGRWRIRTACRYVASSKNSSMHWRWRAKVNH